MDGRFTMTLAHPAR